jgi:putative flippase GtrA
MGSVAKLLRIDFVRFSLVGALGFVINFTILTLLYKVLGMQLFVAQLISGEIALFSNFHLHHTWTYKRHQVTKSIPTLLIQFHLTSWMAIIGTAILVTVGVDLLKLNYIIALFLAGGIAMFWNFVWTKFVIWKSKSENNGVGEAESAK